MYSRAQADWAIRLGESYPSAKIQSPFSAVPVDGDNFAWDLEATQMSMKRSLIQEQILYELELDYNATEASRNICWATGEAAVDHSTVTGWLKRFRGC